MMKHLRIMSVRRITGIFVICFVLFGAVVRGTNIARAAVSPNNIISYEGRLLNTSGAPVADATLSMVFRLYDAASAGTCLWSNSSSSCASTTPKTVTLTDGLFSENLGDAGAGYATIGDGVFQNNAAVYLQVDIGGETLTPRKLFTASPYAVNASVLDGIDSTQFLRTSGGTATGDYGFTGAVFTGASPLVFEGSSSDAFETTFAVSDPTADNTVTFQNASGTVALTSDVAAVASKWTDAGATTYLTSTTDDLAVGGTTVGASPFSVSVASNGIAVGSGSTTNGSILMKASDGDSGNFTYDTDDTLRLHGGDLNLDQNLFVSGGAMTLGTGTPTFVLNNTATLSFTDGTNTLFQIADNGTTGNITASGNIVSTNGAIGTTGTSLRLFVADTGVVSFRDASSNVLLSVTDVGTTGNTVLSGTLQVSGNSIFGNGGPLTLGAGGGTSYVKIGTNSPSFAVGGGDLLVSNQLEVQGSMNAIGATFTGTVVANDFNCTDCIAATDLADILTLDATTSVQSTGGFDFIVDTGNSGAGGDFIVKNTTGPFVDFANDQSTTFTPGTTTTTAFSLNAQSVSSGTAMSIVDSNSLSTGKLLSLNGDSAAFTSGTILDAHHNANYPASATVTGNVAHFNRFLTMNTGGQTLTVNAPVVQIDSNMTHGAGTLNNNASLLSVNQSDSLGTAAVINIGSSSLSAPMLGFSGPNFTDDLGMAMMIDVTETTSTADIVRIQTDFSTANNDVFRIEADGNVYSDTGFNAGTGAGTKYADNNLAGSGAYTFATPSSFTWKDDATNTLMTLTDMGTTGDLNITNDLTVTGDDVQSSGAPLRLNGTAGQPVYVGSSGAAMANGAGDLFVSDNLEVAGSTQFGSPTSAVTWAFASNETTNPLFIVNAAALVDDTSMLIQRPNGGGDFDGDAGANRGLVAIEQLRASGTSDGEALTVTNTGGGSSSAVYIRQTGVDAPGSGTVSQQALVIDVSENAPDNGADEDVMIIRSNIENPGSEDTEFRFQLDGDALADGSFTGGGADFAEFFLTHDADLGNNDVVCRNRQLANAVKRCEPGNHDVVGVVSTNPSFIGNNIPGAERDLRGDANYRVVGMLGQIDTKVTAADGAIAIGDPITTSSTTAGYAGKAHGPVQIIGRALEPLTSGTGMIKVHVTPSWYAGDVFSGDATTTLVSDDLALAAMTTATANATASNSHALAFRGSAWNGTAATTRQMVMLADVSSADVYGISVRNNVGDQVAHISQNGDLALAGKLYPSDRGHLQTDKYIYFDSSTTDGYMRTNAAGWATGSYDFAEMFPSNQSLAAGEVVTFASDNSHVQRSTGTTYDARIAGVISTRPGFLAGENTAGNVPVALTGRVPTYVSGENGAINVGDPLTTSTHAGYAMKATEPGPIVGYAMEPFVGNTGVITAVVRPSYYEGDPVTDAPEADNAASQLMTVSDLDVTGSLNMNGGRILSVGSLAGLGNTWRLDENGDFVTTGRIATEIHSTQGDNVSTYAVTSTDTLLQLSGTATLAMGTSTVDFETIDPHFNDVIAEGAVYRVFLTPSAPTGQLYAVNRTNQGFEIREANGMTDGVTVDWMVMAYRKDFAPDSAMYVAPPEVPPVTDPAVDEPVVDAPENSSPDSSTLETPAALDAPETTPQDDAFVPPPTGEEVVPVPDVVAPETVPEVTTDTTTETTSP